MSVLEYGSGWSTTVIYNALNLNKERLSAGNSSNLILDNHPNPFFFKTIESRKYYLNIAKSRLQKNGKINFRGMIARQNTTTINGSLCHISRRLPTEKFDLIYIDGPNPEHVKNNEKIKYKFNQNIPPLNADPVIMEPTFWPGTFIIVDGRRANVEFLLLNFKRSWREYQNSNDQTLLIQNSSVWGTRNRTLMNFQIYKGF